MQCSHGKDYENTTRSWRFRRLRSKRTNRIKEIKITNYTTW